MSAVASKIKQSRELAGFSQSEIAGRLGVTRQTYAALEAGKREVTLSELERLAEVCGVTISSLVPDEVMVEGREPSGEQWRKYQDMCLAAIDAGGAETDHKITKTKLAKLLYLADFAWFYEHLQPMSGLQYRKLPLGPVPDQFFRMIDELYEAGAIAIEPTQNGAQMISRVEASEPTALTAPEKSLIAKIGQKWRPHKTQDIVDYTHRQLPWKICRNGEVIPYSLITQEEPDRVF